MLRMFSTRDLTPNELLEKRNAKLHKKQKVFTQTFESELITRSSNFNALNDCMISFNLLDLNEKYIGLEHLSNPDFLDSDGNWNKKINILSDDCIIQIDENENAIATHSNDALATSLFDSIDTRLNDLLFPNIFRTMPDAAKLNLSDKEKIILCALIYTIQSQLLEKHLPDMNNIEFTEAVLMYVSSIKTSIYNAARDAVFNTLPTLRENISLFSKKPKEENNMKINSAVLTLGFIETQPLIVGTKPADSSCSPCNCVLF